MAAAGAKGQRTSGSRHKPTAVPGPERPARRARKARGTGRKQEVGGPPASPCSVAARFPVEAAPELCDYRKPCPIRHCAMWNTARPTPRSKVVSPLRKGEPLEVRRIAPEDGCASDMLVLSAGRAEAWQFPCRNWSPSARTNQPSRPSAMALLGRARLLLLKSGSPILNYAAGSTPPAGRTSAFSVRTVFRFLQG